MKRASLLTVCCATVALGAIALAESASFNASRTFEFDPDKTKCPVAYWKNGIGEADSPGNTSFGLQLEKNCPLATNASAGAVLNGIRGTVIAPGPSMGYDIKDTSPCGAGAPRFNVQQADGTFHFVGGCANGTKTPADTPGWTRVTFDPNNPGQSFPVLTPGVPVESVVLIVDEPGQYTLDNIQINGLIADKPGAAK
jgi:hypothetical protein